MKLRLSIAIILGVMWGQAYAAPATTATTPASAAHSKTSTETATPVSPAIPKITVDKNKVSYSIGVDLGENFKSQGIEIDPAMLARGLKDAFAGGNTLYTHQEMESTLIEFQKQLIAKRQAEFTALAAKNLKESNAFLAENKGKPGVVTTSTGLQYKVVAEGSGKAPTAKDSVTVDYAGTLPNGKVFDSSYQRGTPVTFLVSEVIPGWTQVLQLMKPGATYEVYIPANLAYGERGFGPVIGPNQALVFKIHLIKVNPAKS